MSMKWLTGNLLLKNSRKNLLFVLICLSLITSGCSLLPSEGPDEELPTIKAPQLSQKPEYVVQRSTIETKITGIGKLMSLNEEFLFFTEQSNRIQEIYVNTGDPITKGQIIAQLDVTDLKSQLRQAGLQLKSDELQMIETLRKADEISAEELEQAKIAFELKRTSYFEIQEKISRSKLVAPFTGTIVSITMNKGDVVEAYKPVAVIADLSQLTVAVDISTEKLKNIAVGMETSVQINNAGSHNGKVDRLPSSTGGQQQYDPWGNPLPNNQQQDSIEKYLIVKLDTFPPDLSRGTPLSVSIIINRLVDVVVIPPSALRNHVGRSYVQVIDKDGNKREVDVEVGQQTSTLVEIVKGLEPGQKVVGR